MVRSVKSYREAYQRFKAGYWRHLLRKHDGNVTATARTAKVSRTWLHKEMVKLKLKNPCGTRWGGHRGDWGDLQN